MDAEDLEKFRPAFETTVAIGLAEAGVSLGPDPFRRDDDGDYELSELDLMFKGYGMGLVHGFAHGRGGPVVVEVPCDPNVQGNRIPEAINPHNSPPDDVARLEGAWDLPKGDANG